jgi:Glycerol-3-phosphate O-acyltransferase
MTAYKGYRRGQYLTIDETEEAVREILSLSRRTMLEIKRALPNSSMSSIRAAIRSLKDEGVLKTNDELRKVYWVGRVEA